MNPNQYPPQPGQPPQPYPPQQPGPYGCPPQQGPYAPQPGYGPPQPPMPPQPYGPAQPGYGPPQPLPTSGYNPYPYPGEAIEPRHKGPNKLILGVVAVVVILAVLFAILSAGNSGNKTAKNPAPSTSSAKPAGDVETRTDGRLVLSDRVSLNKSLKAQTLKADLNQQVNLSSGFSFMATKIDVYTSPNPTTKPADGKMFVVVTAVVGNRNDTSNISVSYLDFRLRDTNNVLLAGSPITNEILDNPLSNPSEIKPGEQLTGKVVFEVAANDTAWVFKHSETYQKTTDNTTFVVEGEIVTPLARSAADTSGSTPSTDTPSVNTPQATNP